MFLSWICLAVLFLLLRYPALSIRGASQGLLLWYQVVVPSLAPFMLLTQLIQAAGGVSILTKPFYPLLHRLYGTSRTGAYILICGLLCGYPIGARLCADNCRKGEISPAEAQSLLCVCNHPSPMFLLGYVASQLGLSGLPGQAGAASPLGFPGVLGLLLFSVYAPVPFLYFLSARYYGKTFFAVSESAADPTPTGRRHCNETRHRRVSANSDECDEKDGVLPVPRPAFSFGELILSTSEALVIIGGTLMLFTILIVWLQQLPLLTVRSKALLAGFLEITTGIYAIGNAFPSGQNLIPAAMSIAFGGCSGILQTLGVIRQPDEPHTNVKNAGLSIRHYICWKALHAFLSALVLTLLRELLPR